MSTTNLRRHPYDKASWLSEYVSKDNENKKNSNTQDIIGAQGVQGAQGIYKNQEFKGIQGVLGLQGIKGAQGVQFNNEFVKPIKDYYLSRDPTCNNSITPQMAAENALLYRKTELKQLFDEIIEESIVEILKKYNLIQDTHEFGIDDSNTMLSNDLIKYPINDDEPEKTFTLKEVIKIIESTPSTTQAVSVFNQWDNNTIVEAYKQQLIQKFEIL
jgi:hypothetical protein